MGVGGVVGIAGQHDLAAAFGDGIDLDLRRGGRHYDHGTDAELLRRQRDALRVVAGRGADHAPLPLRRRQMHDLVVGAAQLEAEHRLHVLALEQYAVAAARREDRRQLQRRFDGHVIDAGVEYLFEIVHDSGKRFGSREG